MSGFTREGASVITRFSRDTRARRGRAHRPVSNPDEPSPRASPKADVVRYFLAVGDGILARPVHGTARGCWSAGRAAVCAAGRSSSAGRATRRRGCAPSPTSVSSHRARRGDRLGGEPRRASFHPSHQVRADDLAHPDELRIEHEPPAPAPADRDAVRVAGELRGLLDGRGLRGHPRDVQGRARPPRRRCRSRGAGAGKRSAARRRRRARTSWCAACRRTRPPSGTSRARRPRVRRPRAVPGHGGVLHLAGGRRDGVGAGDVGGAGERGARGLRRPARCPPASPRSATSMPGRRASRSKRCSDGPARDAAGLADAGQAGHRDPARRSSTSRSGTGSARSSSATATRSRSAAATRSR